MPLTDEEWVAFINEYNAMVNDVSRQLETLRTACQAYERSASRADGQEAVRAVAQTYTAIVEIQAGKVIGRVNALSRRINEMRRMGEL